jgi:hypothetical protein
MSLLSVMWPFPSINAQLCGSGLVKPIMLLIFSPGGAYYANVQMCTALTTSSVTCHVDTQLQIRRRKERGDHEAVGKEEQTSMFIITAFLQK